MLALVALKAKSNKKINKLAPPPTNLTPLQAEYHTVYNTWYSSIKHIIQFEVRHIWKHFIIIIIYLFFYASTLYCKKLQSITKQNIE